MNLHGSSRRKRIADVLAVGAPIAVGLSIAMIPIRLVVEGDTGVRCGSVRDLIMRFVHLVTEDGVLELELCDSATPSEQPDEAYEHEVGEGSQGARMPPGQRRSRPNRVFGAHTLRR